MQELLDEDNPQTQLEPAKDWMFISPFSVDVYTEDGSKIYKLDVT